MIKKAILAFRNLLASHEDAKLSRRLAGTDRYGNKYYEYYDEKGKPYRRILEPNPGSSETFDPLWKDWLHFIQKTPYSTEELKKFYQMETEIKKKAFEYEVKDYEMMKEFRKEHKKSLENEKTTVAKGTGENYNPGAWKPANKGNENKEN